MLDMDGKGVCKEILIIEDDSEFMFNGKASQTLFSQSEDDNVIYQYFFQDNSAVIMCGIYAASQKLLPLYENTVGFYSCTVPMLEQFFLSEWLDSGEFERTISSIRNRTE